MSGSQSRLDTTSPAGAGGFTLLEVVVAMAIMAFISLGIYQATVETFKLRDTLAAEGTFYNTIRLAMSIVQKDIALIYSPTLLLPKGTVKPNAPPLMIPNMPGEDLQSPYLFWSPAIHETGLRPSRFSGTDSKLSFISLTYSRIYKDTPGSEFAKISYELKREEKDTEAKGTSVLVKTESPNAYTRDDKDQLVQTYDLLHGVKKLSFSYLFREGNTWRTLKSFDSEQEQPKYSIPDLIVIDIEVAGGKNLSFEGKYKFRPEIPFNGIPATE